ncbi:MAG: cytochrome b/b6 domain-containing protein [Deltaproteobacteria bacterium]|nr:cytochrome b/b6 domain-containing protein [Deltaproteobacteria bacterium]
MKTLFVYDFPTRIFHWLFALLFVAAFTIGKNVDDDSVLFSYHMRAGIVMSSLVLFRIVWGLLGSNYARFTGFSLQPVELLRYFKGILSGDKRKWAGHNPASSWAAIVMMVLALGLGLTGYLMASGEGGDAVEDVHELMANGFLIVVLLHLAGVAIHSLRHRDAIWKSMINGVKVDVTGGSSLVHPYKRVGMLLLLAVSGLATYLVLSFDSESRNLAIFGSKIHLAEADEH